MKKYQSFLKAYAVFITIALVAVLSIGGFRKVQKKKYKLARKIEVARSIPEVSVLSPKRGDGVLVAKYPVREFRPIVVLITSYNNESVCEKNLESVFSQTYSNYRVIYVDDCSTDKTLEKVVNYIDAKGMKEKVSVVHNEVRSIKMANLYKACLSCRDDEIIAFLDGDDWLIHEKVLETLNQYYQNPDVWMTHGSAIIHPGYRAITGHKIDESTIRHNEVREIPFCMSMLRTCYAGLFKQLKLKDLFFQGDFVLTADDPTFMIPMAEMAGEHCIFIPDVLYVINDNNPIREQRTMATLQEILPTILKKREKYKPLDYKFNPRRPFAKGEEPPNVYLFSSGTPELLKEAISSLSEKLTFYSRIHVLCKSTSQESNQEYQEISKEYPMLDFVFQDHEAFLAREEGDFAVFLSDKMILDQEIHMAASLKEMNQTKASVCLIQYPDVPVHKATVSEKVLAATVENLVKFPEFFKDEYMMIVAKPTLKKLLNVQNFSQHVMETCLTSVMDSDDVALLSR